MKYNQSYRYQNIDGGGRNCDDRWDIIKKYIKEDKNSISLDVGSAEGVFSKKISNLTKGNVVSIEGSDFVYNEQVKYCEDEIKSGKIKLHKTELNSTNLSNFTNTEYTYSLLLSVLHWCEIPDDILRDVSKISQFTFVELPDLEDTKSYGQEYLKRIKKDYGNIENYLQEITQKPVIGAYKVEGNNSNYRVVYVIHQSTSTVLVDINSIYHMIHGNSNTIEDAYQSGNFKILPIKKSPVVSFINGNIDDYTSQSKLFYKRESSIKYLLNEYELGNRDWLIKVVFYKGKYIISDGMHRSSILMSKGYSKIFVKIVSSPTEPTAIFERYITDDRIYNELENAWDIESKTKLKYSLDALILIGNSMVLGEHDKLSDTELYRQIQKSLSFLSEVRDTLLD